MDRWHLLAGNDRFAFMERGIESADKVLVLCDFAYTEKANQRDGGVGTETEIITPNVYEKSDQRKFIPVVMEDFGYMPDYVKSRSAIDFRNGHREKGYQELLRAIYDKPENIKPQIGERPKWLG